MNKNNYTEKDALSARSMPSAERHACILFLSSNRLWDKSMTTFMLYRKTLRPREFK